MTKDQGQRTNDKGKFPLNPEIPLQYTEAAATQSGQAVAGVRRGGNINLSNSPLSLVICPLFGHTRDKRTCRQMTIRELLLPFWAHKVSHISEET